MCVAHKPLNFCLGNHCRNGIHDDYVDGTGTHKGFSNFKRLLACIRLRNKKAVYINAQCLCINRVKGMLDINECGFAARFLCGSYYVKGNGGFTGAFRPKNLDDPSAGHAAYAKGAVQSYGSGGYSLYIKGGRLPKLHNRTFSVLFFKLFYRGIKSVFFAGICHWLFLL